LNDDEFDPETGGKISNDDQIDCSNYYLTSKEISNINKRLKIKYSDD